MLKYRGTLTIDGQAPYTVTETEKNSLLITMNICARVGAAFADFANSKCDKSRIVIEFERLSLK